MGAAVETMARIIAVAAISLLIASANAYDLGFSEDVRAFIEGTEHLKAIVEMAEQDEAGLAQLIVESPLAAIASNVTVGPRMEKNNSVPLVVAHGMGDSCSILECRASQRPLATTWAYTVLAFPPVATGSPTPSVASSRTWMPAYVLRKEGQG